ncbi:MAG TPA: hypothetical protein VH107_14400 [Lacipirellulaceae bacterium]|jgi:hypothetical protein|nr:hypothetical protein [Lacipirellulaceae bacterium]
MFDEREPAEPELTPELQALEGKLARLSPAAVRLDRDRLMFEAGMGAGRAASEPSPSPSLKGQRNVWVWRGGAALMTAASLVLATMLVWQRQEFDVALREAKQPAVAPQLASAQPTASSPPAAVPEVSTANWIALRQPAAGYLGIRYTAVTRGVDAIESESRDGSASRSSHQLERNERDIMNDFLPSAKQSRSRS